jgi:tetratricopeptide (TPR) repeat protein
VCHVTDEEISRLVSGRLTGAAHLRVFRHLLSACPVCSPKCAPYLAVLEGREAEDLPEAEAAVYESILDRTFAGAARHAAHLAEDRAWHDRFVAEVRAREIVGFDAIVDAMDWEMPGRAKVEALLTLSFEARYRDPEEMRSLAEGATITADNLGREPGQKERYAPAEVADLKARAWAELANAHRVCEDPTGAEEALSKAHDFQALGTGDPLLAARLLDVLASLRTDQRRLDEAVSLLDQIHLMYLNVGETHLAGRALISKGICIAYDDRPREAIAWFRQGLSLVDPQRDPELRLTGDFSLLRALVESGEYREGQRLLLESGLRHAFAAEPLKLLKIRWLEGITFAGLGKLQRAEHVFSEVEDGFLRAGLEYEAALVGLERAGVLLRQGRMDAMEAVVEEALETFRALQVGREAVRAVQYLWASCGRKAATADLVRRVIDFLQKLQSRPYLRFVPA